jgi:hypothetical protein
MKRLILKYKNSSIFQFEVLLVLYYITKNVNNLVLIAIANDNFFNDHLKIYYMKT